MNFSKIFNNDKFAGMVFFYTLNSFGLYMASIVHLTYNHYPGTFIQKQIFSLKEGIIWPYSVFHADPKNYFDYNNMSDEQYKKFLINLTF